MGPDKDLGDLESLVRRPRRQPGRQLGVKLDGKGAQRWNVPGIVARHENAARGVDARKQRLGRLSRRGCGHAAAVAARAADAQLRVVQLDRARVDELEQVDAVRGEAVPDVEGGVLKLVEREPQGP